MTAWYRTWLSPIDRLDASPLDHNGGPVPFNREKDQARRLAEEINLLRHRLARQLGAEADIARGQALVSALDQLEARNAELEADNHRQQLIARLQANHHELAETLEAARAMNRELMSELNRRPQSHRAGPPATASDRRQAVSTTSSTLDTANDQDLPG